MSLPSTSAPDRPAKRPPAPSRAGRALVGELSGAFADLGTFLPLVVGVLAVRQFDPVGVLCGFGLFALSVALIYRRPVPVQPMKVVAALVLAAGLSPAETAATGILLGAVLLVLALSGLVDRLARAVPETVVAGIQVGLGLYLAWAGVKLMWQDPALGVAAVVILGGLSLTRWRAAGSLAVLLAAGLIGYLGAPAPLPAFSPRVQLPEVSLPDWAAFVTALQSALLPQLALTLTNAVIVTAALAAHYFPTDADRITPKRLALSTSLLNLALAPFGAFPMCHGAGGLVVQHRFGARTGLAPAIFGASCLALGLGLGTGAMAWLQIVPLVAVGGLLLIAGAGLAATRSLRELPRPAWGVVAVTALGCVAFNVALGLIAGLVAERLLRSRIESMSAPSAKRSGS